MYGELPTITEEYNRRKLRELDKQRRANKVVQKLPDFPPLERVEDQETEYINSVLGEFELIKQCGLLREYGIVKPKSYLNTPPSSPNYSMMSSPLTPESERSKPAASLRQPELKEIRVLTENNKNVSPTKICRNCIKRKERRKLKKAKKMAEEKALTDRLLMPPPPPPVSNLDKKLCSFLLDLF